MEGRKEQAFNSHEVREIMGKKECGRRLGGGRDRQEGLEGKLSPSLSRPDPKEGLERIREASPHKGEGERRDPNFFSAFLLEKSSLEEKNLKDGSHKA